MKKTFAVFSVLLIAGVMQAQQGPGLILSEILPNPTGTDSPFEFAEMVATRTINFASTPYTVVVCNNGIATTSGWVSGNALSYAFEINTGTVNAGDVVYVGGSSLAPTGTILRAINTGTTNGDGFGTASTGGVFGNGGTNADGIAIFASAAASLTNTSVPVDALFYGAAAGTAVVNSGIDGYELPYNDLYAGGKLQSSSYLATDPASAQYLTATGTFNPSTGSFTAARSWSINTAFSNNATGITLSTGTPAATVAFSTTNQTVSESAGTATVTVSITNPNNGQVIIRAGALSFSNASSPADYTISPATLVVPANTSGTQTFTITITDDAIAESDEYIALGFTLLSNATASPTAAHFLYIRDNDNPAPVATNELITTVLASYSNGSSASNSAEIVAHDPATQRLYIANSVGAKLDIVNFSNPSAPTALTTINIAPYGNINSVAVKNGLVAAAIENGTNPQDSGKIVFFDAAGNYLNQVKVGAMPDMITFNHAGTKVITACEGEPNAAYTNDPDGRVCVVDISAGIASVTQANVAFINFTSFNGQEASLRSQGIRIYGPGATASKDFEPEYVTVSDDDLTAWVTLQENNAIAKIDLVTNSVTQLLPLGYKNHNTLSNTMDASDVTAGINLSNFPVRGLYLPDAIYQFTIAGQPYLVTANEGDSRAYTGFSEELNFSALNLDPTIFPQAAIMKSNFFLGKLKVTNTLGDIDNDGDFDAVYSYGARSFSIWNGNTGAQVYDNGDQFERITSTHPVYSSMFNASNSTSATPKNRSDDKGPEPEGVVTAQIDGEWYAFIALERIGGVMIYNVTNPAAPYYVGYNNNRSFATNGPDRGAEGIIFIPASSSPNGHSLLILANETSSTLTILEVNTCAQVAGVSVTPSSSATICSGSSITLNATNVANTNYQWYLNNTAIPSANSNSISVNTAGNYSLGITSASNGCIDRLPTVTVSAAPQPVVTINASSTAVCSGNNVTLSGSGATTYSWSNGISNNIAFVPSATNTYTVIGTDSNGCTDTNSIQITVNTLPSVTAGSSASSVCSGSSVTLNGGGASTYVWSGGVTNNVAFIPASTNSYTVTGTDANGCSNTASVTVTVNSLPAVSASATATTICSGSNTTLSGSGASTYSWTGGAINNTAFAPAASATYTVTGTDANGCTNTATIAITVNPRPNVVANASSTFICAGSSVTLAGSGANSYTWSGGVLNNVPFVPTATNTYTVTGTNANGCTNTASATIIVNPLPNVGATASSNTLCAGESVILNGSGANTYSWTGGINNGVSFIPAAGNNTYTVTGTGNYGCTNTATISILVHALPVVSFTAPNPDTVCLSSSAFVLSGGAPAGGVYSGIGVNNGNFDPAVAGLGMQQIWYQYTDNNGCTDSSAAVVTVEICTGIETAGLAGISIVPNPTNEFSTIHSNDLMEQIEIFDASGRLVESTSVNQKDYTINLGQQPAGIYFIRVHCHGSMGVLRLARM